MARFEHRLCHLVDVNPFTRRWEGDRVDTQAEDKP